MHYQAQTLLFSLDCSPGWFVDKCLLLFEGNVKPPQEPSLNYLETLRVFIATCRFELLKECVE